MQSVAPGGRVDTPEEQALRRAEARERLQLLYVPSQVEADYRQRLGDENLKQFGYDYFQSAPPPSGVRTGAIGDTYVLGIGDQLQISFRGATSRSETGVVDRDGRLIVSGLSPVVAAGRSLAHVRQELQAETRRTMLATDVFVTVGEVRSISIFVGGEVERPGQFSLTSVTDVVTAIASAGGVRRSGSLRQVRVVRAGGGTTTVDLYGFLGIGAPAPVQLRDGDRVIVPVIGPTIAINGGVARPGIYELRGPTTIAQVVSFAGGVIRQRGAQVVVSRIAADGGETFIRAKSGAEAVAGGDALQILGASPGGASGRVGLYGYVNNAGSRPLVAAQTVAELVGSPADLLNDTYQLAAILRRRDQSSGARDYQVLNLAHELTGQTTTRLQSEDALFLFSRDNILFLNSDAVRKSVMGQADPAQTCVALIRLDRLVRDTGNARFSSVTRAGGIVDGALKRENIDNGMPAALAGLAQGSENGGGVNGALLNGDRSAATSAPKSGSDLDPESACPAIFAQQPEMLSILIEHAVSVGGSVRRPGAYPVAGQVSARDLALVADGLLVGARALVLDVSRGSGVHERLEDENPSALLNSAYVSSGDDLRFNAIHPDFEVTGVQLSGEILRPGLYTLRKGEKLSELLKRAGGLTEAAYPYGAVFTRPSVKSAQAEGYKRTARELNNSLLSIAARSEGKSSLEGASDLIRTLSEVEATGRVVVEADPRVLSLRPDLDTPLQGGDALYIPKRPNYVMALGDVSNPGAQQFIYGKSVTDYVRDSGGVLATADRNRAFMVLPNGTAQPVHLRTRGGEMPPPGTTIIVPKNIDPLYKLNLVRDVTTILAQLATSVATVVVLATR